MHLLIIGCLVCHASLAHTASVAQNVPPNIWPGQWPPAPPIRPAPSLPVPTVPTGAQNSVPSSNAASSPPAPQQNMSALLQSLIQKLDYPRRQKTLALLSRYRQLYLQSLLAQRAQQLRSLNQQKQKVISPQRATSQPAQNVNSQPTPSVASEATQQAHGAQPPSTAQVQIPTVFRPRPPASGLFQFQPHLFPTQATPQRAVASPSVQPQPSTASSPSVPPAETVEEPEEVESPDPSDSEGDEDDDTEESDADEEEPVEHSEEARASHPLSLPSGDAFSILRKISGNGQGSAGVFKQKPQLSVQSQPSAAAVHQQYQQFLQHAAKLIALKKTPPHQTHLPLNPPTQQRIKPAPPVQVSPKPNILPAPPPFLRPLAHQAQPGPLARPFLYPFPAPINSTHPQQAIPSFLFPLAPKSSTPAPPEPTRPQSLPSQQIPRLPSFPWIRNPSLTTQSPPVPHAQSTTPPASSVETLIEPSPSPSFPTVTEKPVDDDVDFPWDSFRAYIRSSSNGAPKTNTNRVNGLREAGIVKAENSVTKVVYSEGPGRGNSAVESDKTSEPKPKDWWHHYFLLERPQSELEPKPERANKWWLKYKEERPSSIEAEQGQNNVGLWEAISRHEQEVQEQKEEKEKKQRRQERWGKVKEVFSSLLNKLTN